MNQPYTFRTAAAMLFILLSWVAYAQPTVLGTQLANGTYVTYDLNTVGGFKQFRMQTSSSAAVSTRNWEFATGTAGATVYTTNWRPYTGGNTLSANTFIPTSFANGAKYNTASGGASGLLPAITSGNYYTFNVSNNAAADNVMQLLETTFDPVTIPTITQAAGTFGSRTVTITTSATPDAAENIFVRYSTNSYTSSTIVQATGSGMTWTATIPAQSVTVNFYVYTSNKSKAQIDADVTIYGQGVHDMSTLNLNNNSGSNYTYFPINVTSTSGSSTSASYATLAAAITAINGGTAHTGTIVCSVNAGYTETAPTGGFSITATGTLANSITFVKAGTGTNPTFTAFLNPPVGQRYDAVIKIIGGDYITIDGFTLQENSGNTTGGAANVQMMTEFGIGIFASSTTNGAQNNTIQNCTITLSSSTPYQNAIGIFSTSASSSTNATQAASSIAGTNSNNKFYSNSISGVASGIYFISPSQQTATVFESGNDIGGASIATGNNITFGISNIPGDLGFFRYGGTTAAGVYFRNVVGNSARFNTINSAFANTLSKGGIFSAATAPPTGITYTSNFSDNSITITNTTGPMTGIDFGSGLTTGTIIGSANTITLNQTTSISANLAVIGISANYTSSTNTCNSNIITINQTTSGAAVTTSPLTGLTVAGASTTINALNNAITFNQTTSSSNVVTGAVNGILATEAATTLNIGSAGNGNTITIKQAVSGLGIYGTSAVTYVDLGNVAHGTANVDGNTFNTTGSTIRSTGNLNCVLQGAVTISTLVNVSNNTVNIDRVATSGAVGFFTQTITGPNDPLDTYNSNNIIFTSLAGTTSVTVIQKLGGSPSASRTMNNNTISVSGTNTGTVIAFSYANSSLTTANSNSITISCAAPTIRGFIATTNNSASSLNLNTISLTTSATSLTSIIGINLAGSGGHIVSNTTFSALNATGIITGGGAATAISISNGTAANIFNNVITNISVGAPTSTASPIIDGILISGGTGVNAFKNKVYGITTAATGSSTIISGIRISAGGFTNPNNIYNNLIGDLTAGAATSPDAIRGINITSTAGSTNHNVSYNTVFLSGSGGTNFGASGLFHSASATSTNSNLTLKNNIIVNNVVPNGTGLTVAYRRNNGISASTLSNYNSASNNNLFYAGTPGATNLIYSDGFGSAQTIAAYKAGVFPAGTIAPRDNASVTETIVPGTFFLSTAGSSPDFLHINPSNATQVESGGMTIGGITDDFDGDTRNVSTPDIGADEFNGTAPAPTIVLSANDVAAGNLTPGTNNNPIYSFAIASTVANANLTGLSISTTGSYLSADVTNLKVYYQATTPYVLGSATLLSTLTTPGTAGAKTFTPFTTATIANGATGYIFITADIPCAATATNTIAVDAVTTSNTTFASSSSLTGAGASGNTQTIVSATINNATSTAATVAGGSSSVSWTNPTGCFTEVMIVARAGSANDGIPIGDGTAYTGNLVFGSGTALGSGFVVYKGTTSSQVITGLTNGTQYFFKIFTRFGSIWSSGTEVSATPAINYCTSTGPASQGSDYFTSFNATVSGVGITNTSTYSANGYGNFTAQSVTQAQGGSVNYSMVSPGVSDGSSFGIFVDWNQDGDFLDTNEQPFLTTSPQASTNPSGSFTVPVGSTLGSTRMRIVVKDATGAVSSCNTATANSETEDYTFIVTAPATPTITNLSAYSGCAGSTLTINGTNLTGATVPNITVGGTPVASITSNNGTQLVVVLGAGTTGIVSVTTPGGTATDPMPFTFNPPAAAVTVTGAGTYCTSTTIIAANGGDGTIYFQGTTTGGTSTATASASQIITTSGTYYFRAQTALGCWGVEGSAAVVIQTPISITPGNATICAGGSGSMTATSTCAGFSNSGTSFSGTWVAATDPIALRPATSTNSATCSFDPTNTRNYVVTNFQVSVAGNYTFEMNNNAGYDGMAYLVQGAFVPGNCSGGGTFIKGDDDGGTGDEPLITATLSTGVTYTMISTTFATTGTFSGSFAWTVTPPSGGQIMLPNNGNIDWYTAASGGTSIGSGSPFNPVPAGLADTNTPGTTTFYAACSNASTCRTAVNFVINPNYTITATSGANGTVTPAGITTICSGGNQTYTITPDACYSIASLTVDGSPASLTTGTFAAGGTYVFSNVTAPHTIDATFVQKTFTLTYIEGTGGSIMGTTPQMVNCDANGTAVTAVADACYHFVSWSDGVLTATRTDMNVMANISVTASFAINTYTLTYTAGANGSISGTSPQMVNCDANGTAVTAVADACYHFVSWSDGVLTATRTDMNVMANISVTATFAFSGPYTITATSGSNGTVTPAGMTSVTCGNNQVYTITPDAGYHILDVLIDGVTNPTAITSGTYTFSNVMANGTISVSFEPNVTTIISGKVVWEHNDVGVKDVVVSVTGAGVGSSTTDIGGNYSVTLPVGGDFTITPAKNTNLWNGVDVADAMAIQQHVTGASLITDPYKQIAADVFSDLTISTLDAFVIKQSMLENLAALAAFTPSWRFSPQNIVLTAVNGIQDNNNFIGIKVGDVNGDSEPENKGVQNVKLITEDQELVEGQEISVSFRVNHFDDFAAHQLVLQFDPSYLQFMVVDGNPDLPFSQGNFGTLNTAQGELRTVWSQATGSSVSDGTEVFTLNFKVLKGGTLLSNVLGKNEEIFIAKAYKANFASAGIDIEFTKLTSVPEVENDKGVVLLQNKPNPFDEQTIIGFVLPSAGTATIRVHNNAGMLIAQRKDHYNSGYHEEVFTFRDGSGVLYYELITDKGIIKRKMIQIRR